VSTPTISEITVEALEADPFPIYARLREKAPVCFVPAVGLHLVTRWDDVQHVATHPEIFTAEVDASPLVRTLGVNVLTVDGADIPVKLGSRGHLRLKSQTCDFPPISWS